MLETIIQRVFVNWRTTLIGAVYAATSVMLNLVIAGNISGWTIALAGLLAGVGAACKDTTL